MAKKRTDAERRARPAERLARVLRVLECIQATGPWTAPSLASELEFSERTIYRDLQTLSMTVYYDNQAQSCRVRSSFRLSQLTID